LNRSNTTTNTVVGSINRVGDLPQLIAYDTENKRIYVTDSQNSIVSVIDTNTNMLIGSPIPVGDFPFGIAYDPVNHRMYVTNSGDNTVFVINLC
jgi:YVTN family beta-propeller protein